MCLCSTVILGMMVSRNVMVRKLSRTCDNTDITDNTGCVCVSLSLITRTFYKTRYLSGSVAQQILCHCLVSHLITPYSWHVISVVFVSSPHFNLFFIHFNISFSSERGIRILIELFTSRTFLVFLHISFHSSISLN